MFTPFHFTTRVAAWLVLGCLLAGCGGSPEPVSDGTQRGSRVTKKSRKSNKPGTRFPRAKPSDTPDRNDRQESPAPASPATDTPAPTGPAEAPEDEPRPEPPRSLADLLQQPADSAARWIPNLPRLRVDDARAAAAGIRKLSGKRLTLYTDMPPAEQIEQLPEVFDRAFPQWCEYFDVDPAKHADWEMTGFLMQDKARFQPAGLLPESLPPFRNGFARNYELWLYDQPSDYYRRHLLLHEGTHGFMNTILGGCGPPWYMEGTAELLSTHLWRDGRLTLNYMPADREEVPHWGRIRIIKDAVAAGRPVGLVSVIEYPPNAHLETEPYAWCWAAATLLDRHPRYQERFRRLYKNVLAPDFSERFYRLYRDDWDRLRAEWQLLVAGMEYGHDIARTAVDFTPGKPLPQGGTVVTIAAKGGWQNAGVRLDGGVDYRLRAAGRYQVADKPQVWWCEPGGVSIRYYHGRPLGVLLAAVRPDRSNTKGSSALLRPVVVGLGTTLSPRETGTLYLRINDSAAELADNAGELKVEIER